MKRTLMMLLLTLAASLGAIVNLGDEYIGSTPMGQFRKTGETVSYNSYEGDGGDHDSTDYTYYYYNEFFPTRLDSVYTNLSGGMAGGAAKVYYEYTEFEDCYLATMSRFSWSFSPKGEDFELRLVCNYKYDHQDRMLEYQYTFGDPVVDKGVYTYNANGDLSLIKEYKTVVSETVPFRVTTYEYDEQNRLTHMQAVEGGVVIEAKWKTWGDHPLPDSTYTINRPGFGWDYEITKNYYDGSGVRNSSVLMLKSRYDTQWRRYDTIYTYTFAHGMAFPITANVSYGYVTNPDDPFQPVTTFPRNYTYTDAYHKVEVSPNPYEYYTYNDDWLLTRHVDDDREWRCMTKTISWQQYATSTDDPVAVPPALVSAYPNPAKGQVNISLSKRDAAPAKAKVYNIKGQLVRSLAVSDLSGDEYLYNWDCKDDSKRAVPAGVYLIRIKTGGGEVNKKVTVIK